MTVFVAKARPALEGASKNAVIFAVSACVVSLIAGFHPLSSIDAFALVSDGRWMLSSGFHFLYENPYSPVPAPIVCQEWGLSIALALLVDRLGWDGLGVWSSLQAVLLLSSITYLMLGTDAVQKMVPERQFEMAVAVGTASVMLACPLISIRPLWLSAAILCFEVGLVRRYCSDARIWRIMALAGLLLVESNFHASFIWLDLSIVIFSACIFGWGRCPQAKCLLLSIPIVLVNPYGVEGVLYLPKAALALRDVHVNEMLPLLSEGVSLPSPTLWLGRVSCGIVLVLCISALIQMRGAFSREKLFFLIISSSGCVLALAMVRNLWMPLVLLPMAIAVLTRLPETCSNIRVPQFAETMLLCAALVMALGTFPGANDKIAAYPQSERLVGTGIREPWDKWHETAFGSLSYNGRLEAYGKYVTMDTRPEIWAMVYLPGSETSFLEDYVAMVQNAKGNINSMMSYIEKYNIKSLYDAEDSPLSTMLPEQAGIMGYLNVGTDDFGMDVYEKTRH